MVRILSLKMNEQHTGDNIQHATHIGILLFQDFSSTNYSRMIRELAIANARDIV